MDNNSKIIEPKTLQGFIELMPDEQILFNKMYKQIEESFKLFGFIPLDTPILEYSEVLLAKAGGETEKQIYRFNKGDTDISMRFDLTVPLAKYVAKNYGKLVFPFRRYQIGKVFRGERPQKGRFREFYQCDIDIIGDGELNIMNDSEIPSIIYTTFKNMGFDRFVIKINNRKVLNGYFNSLGLTDKIPDILRTVDKMDKIGKDSVSQELEKLEIVRNKIDGIIEFLNISGNNSEIIGKLKELDIENDMFKEGVDELEKVVDYVKAFKVPDQNFIIDLKIARGLDYYTGTIYETNLIDYPELGSVCSGGRYDNLAEYYTKKKLPGVGISIGISRLYAYLVDKGVISPKELTPSKAVIIPMNEDLNPSFDLASKIREEGVAVEVGYNKKNVKAMLGYANRLKVPYVIFLGEEEINSKMASIKNMETGEQEKIEFDKIVEYLNKRI